MRTLIGHLGNGGGSSSGKGHQHFYQGLESGAQRWSKPWKTAAPFTPLRQPMAGHGNPRKEHRAT